MPFSELLRFLHGEKSDTYYYVDHVCTLQKILDEWSHTGRTVQWKYPLRDPSYIDLNAKVDHLYQQILHITAVTRDQIGTEIKGILHSVVWTPSPILLLYIDDFPVLYNVTSVL